MLSIILCVALEVFIYMNFLFVMALALKRNDIVDIAWGMGFVLTALYLLILVPDYHWRRLLVSALVIVWGVRLATYIFIRNRGKQEDFRYAQWRREWGKSWIIRSWLQVFVLQGFFMLSIAYPLFFFRQGHSKPINILDVLGILIWLTGFGFEAIGDAQMLIFKKNQSNKGKIMNRGLWRYTRHPNYFGEATMWWGIFLITLNTLHGWLAIFSPIIITTLLLKVSGVPMLEKKYATNPEYQAYVKSTSSFFPWFKRK